MSFLEDEIDSGLWKLYIRDKPKLGKCILEMSYAKDSTTVDLNLKLLLN